MFEPEQFYEFSPLNRRQALEEAICREHAYHFERNAAYRKTVQGRGVAMDVSPGDDFSRLLRPSAISFKGYIERIGPFPQLHPAGFLDWLGEQVSIPLPEERRGRLRRQYASIEDLLLAVESLYAEAGIEVVTSSGTSGRTSFVVRDRQTIELAVNSFFSGIRRSWQVQRGMAMVFMMPRETRIAMARVARLGTNTLDWASDSPVYYTVPFAATPDLIRIRTGRIYLPGMRGWVEKRFLNPWIHWANEKMGMPRTIQETVRCLQECIQAGRPVMLLGGMVQLHLLSRQVSLKLPPGSRVATGGGMKEQYPVKPSQIRADLQTAFGGAPVSDVYGMAEANWAAFECPAGSHHMPPWVYAAVTDDDDRLLHGADSTGLLAFFDPLGGGRLIPPFFQTADRVRLINGATDYDPQLVCPCGMDTPYIRGWIQRVDLMEEAGCAAQV